MLNRIYLKKFSSPAYKHITVPPSPILTAFFFCTLRVFRPSPCGSIE